MIDTDMTMRDRALFVNVRSYYFRGACSQHNAEHGRFLSWHDARDLWRGANYDAKIYVYGIA
jgi:hypothetical protein